MNFGAAFSFITADKDWLKKIAIGALLALTGVGTFAVMGWMMEIIRRYKNEEEELLPDWSGIGQYFVGGLKMWVIGFVWMLPVILFAACFGGIIAIAGNQMNTSDAETLTYVLSACFGLFALVYGLLVTVLMVPMAGTLADTGEIGKAINPANAFKLLRGNVGGFLLAAIAAPIIIALLSMVGAIACGIGSYFGMAFGWAFYGHMVGQAYKKAVESLPLLEAAE